MSDQLIDVLSAALTPRTGFNVKHHCVLATHVGSIAHGTHMTTGTDDVDVFMLLLPPPERVLGVTNLYDNTVLAEGVYDIAAYSLAKFVGLLSKCNPNVMGVLWSDFPIYTSAIAEDMRAQRKLFVSRLAFESFTGYARGQFKRMTTFDIGRMDEYDRLEAVIEAAGYTARQVLEVNDWLHKRMGWMEHGGLHPDVADAMTQFRKLHRQYFSGFMGAKRKRLVRELGYDSKNAAHLIRLLRMGTELLQFGELYLNRELRGDAAELKAIKVGEYTLDDIKAKAEMLFEVAEEANEKSSLPDTPDMDVINNMLTHWQLLGWHEQGNLTYESSR